MLQKQFAAERIAALMEERRMLEVDEAARNGVASAKHDELLQRLHRTEDTLQATTKDYILGESLSTHPARPLMLAPEVAPRGPLHVPGLVMQECFCCPGHVLACIFKISARLNLERAEQGVYMMLHQLLACPAYLRGAHAPLAGSDGFAPSQGGPVLQNQA